MLAVIGRAREPRVYNTTHRAERDERVQETSGYTPEPSQGIGSLKKFVVGRIPLAKRDDIADKTHTRPNNHRTEQTNKYITACVHRP